MKIVGKPVEFLMRNLPGFEKADEIPPVLILPVNGREKQGDNATKTKGYRQ